MPVQALGTPATLACTDHSHVPVKLPASWAWCAYEISYSLIVQVQLAENVERFWGRFGDRHLCVSRAMKDELQQNWRIKAVVFYDRPPAQFEPTPLEQKVSAGPHPTRHPCLSGETAKIEQHACPFCRTLHGRKRDALAVGGPAEACSCAGGATAPKELPANENCLEHITMTPQRKFDELGLQSTASFLRAACAAAATGSSAGGADAPEGLLLRAGLGQGGLRVQQAPAAQPPGQRCIA